MQVMEEATTPPEPKKPKRRPPRRKDDPPKVEDTVRPPDADTVPEPPTPGSEKSKQVQATVVDGTKALMELLANLNKAKGNECCYDVYERQKNPLAYALNEVAKDSPILQSWMANGNVFKYVALALALQPIAAHQYFDHIKPRRASRFADDVMPDDQIPWDDSEVDPFGNGQVQTQPHDEGATVEYVEETIPLRGMDIPPPANQ